MSNPQIVEKRALRRASDVVQAGPAFRDELLFDEFWRNGELAIMFGTPGVGKSVLAVQIADAIARGRPLDGFRMPKGRRSVLYIDLVLREAQFKKRYLFKPEGRNEIRAYNLASGLYWEQADGPDEICERIRSAVTESGVKVVIVDSLTAVKQTCHGTAETLPFLKRLRELCNELHVAIMVLTECAPAKGRYRLIDESDMGRSQILCNLADSVFAVGRNPNSRGGAFLVQTRSRSSEIVWTAENAPLCRLKRFENGLLGFSFDERFSPRLDDERRLLICRIHRLKEEGCTFEEIARVLNVSRSMAQRLNKKWTPSMERDEDEDQFHQDCIEAGVYEAPSEVTLAAASEKERFHEEDPASEEEPWTAEDDADSGALITEPAGKPVYELAGPHSWVFDLEQDVDRRGRDIYIAKRGDKSGWIELYYRFDHKNRLLKYTRTLYGWMIDAVEEPASLETG